MSRKEHAAAGRRDPLAEQRTREPPHRRVPLRLHQPARLRPPRRRDRDVAPGRRLPREPPAAPADKTSTEQRRRRRHRGQGRRQGGRGHARRHAEARHVAGPDDRDRPDQGRRRGRPGRHVRRRGEFLSWSDSKLQLQPRLAESWKPNSDGSVWTFKIRQGVKFHDGTPMTAEDVASSINALSDPKNGSNALSTFAGVLSKGSAKATDASTVEFQLDAPERQLPLPAELGQLQLDHRPEGPRAATWEKTFPGTGPWKLEKYTPNSGVSYVPNHDYWDKTPDPEARPPGGQVLPQGAGRRSWRSSRVTSTCSSTSRRPAARRCSTTRTSRSSSCARRVHREIHMRNDKKPFDDKRVRQAMALAVDRAALVNGLMAGKSDFGNDSPFAPVFPSTDKSVAQRKQDLEKAKALMQQAGRQRTRRSRSTRGTASSCPTSPSCCRTTPQGRARAQARTSRPRARTTATRSSASRRGWTRRWASPTTATAACRTCSSRAPLQSEGVWNAAHFKNPQYDGLVKDYVAALDLAGAAGGGEEDPGAAARRDADHLHLLLLLPHGRRRRHRRTWRCRRWATTTSPRPGFTRRPDARAGGSGHDQVHRQADRLSA